MFLELDGWMAKLRFSASHLIPDHPKCGRLHGHTYAVSVRVEGTQAGEFIIDFIVLKDIVKDICDRLDHRVLVAKDDPRLKITEENGHYTVEIVKSCKHYVLPQDDVLLLPIHSVSAEDLCKYFLHELAAGIMENGSTGNITGLHVRVDEGIGQGAGCTMDLVKIRG
ncbi:MAG: 6-pyruvoyl tetrahydropterin synthase family protein [Methanosarcinales archaeon]|nr:6-pyruvoyl tetrahydropterin synthase family protein [ANME-2 cluster archaeon]MDF1531287.1 6-pyruvoyl tetrahydropterin synthase family protein [ANME-2 cluster archaeon]MDW7776145.1 6-pyruvoyl tetrahydropterin synthase family protein [Methanosarcinales archaeon]